MRTAVLKQRSDYTFKFNRDSGRHGWLRLTPAYSLKIVEEIVDNSGLAASVLDPFCGTGTTALASIYRSKHATSLDLNPFLVWLARVKCATFSERQIAGAREIAGEIVQSILKGVAQPATAPPIHDIDRWWDSNELLFLRLLKGAIDTSSAHDSAESDLLRITFCRVMIKLSNAAFNHQSMSFKERPTQQLRIIDQILRFDSIFLKELETVLSSARANPSAEASIILGDARNLATHAQGPFDLLITSPPYPNRMSYIRELRPYMYWLGYLTEARQAGEMDWETIGGTWGIATSRLTSW